MTQPVIYRKDVLAISILIQILVLVLFKVSGISLQSWLTLAFPIYLMHAFYVVKFFQYHRKRSHE
ncbi:hypothetical protein HMPREF2626_07920 [Aerococcus sp. HMSC062A02]|nr:hypothetical protein HMPREF2626_07920 [Aerococcus sp. HMSC062A02]OHO44443.1 hypothetical protein HMPREF2705_06905 [Aerococcus sp. HMSC035B07]